MQDQKEHIKQLIAEDKLEEALAEMMKAFDQGAIINQLGKLKYLADHVNNGIIKFEDASIERSKIRVSLINILNDIKPDNTQATDSKYQALKELVSKNLKKSLKAISEYIQNQGLEESFMDKLRQQNATYREMEDDFADGLLRQDDQSIIKVKIRKALFNLIDRIQEEQS